MLCWKALDPQKPEKNNCFFTVFGVVCFRYFGALDGPLGLILAPLGPIWSQNGSQNGSPDSFKSTQQGPSWRTRGTGSACQSYLKSSCFQSGSKMTRDGPDGPKITSWEPSWVFRGCLGRPWTPKNLEKQMFFKVFDVVGFRYFGALDGPLGPILAPLGPIWSQNNSQNGSPDGSKSSQDGPFRRSVGTVPGSRRLPKSLIFIVKNGVLGT